MTDPPGGPELTGRPSEDGSSGSGADAWKRAKLAVMPTVGVSQAFSTLRDMSAATFIPPSALTAVKVLGEGAYATVEQAWYSPPGGGERYLVAVKRLRKELFRNQDDLKLFVREVELMRKLRNRNVIEFIGAGELNDASSSSCAYVVQEFMEGGTLKQLVTRQMLANGGRVYSSADGLDVCLQMARGLRYLHRCRPMVIHRDLKLENVLIKSKPAKGVPFEVKLADFGLSRRVDVKRLALQMRRTASGRSRPGGLSVTASKDLEDLWTQRAAQSFTSQPDLRHRGSAAFALTGRTGSLMYMAPEVFHEQPYSEKADVFSFGVMMYEVLQQYIMLSAVSLRGTYDELEEYAARVAAGYRPPLQDKWPPSVASIITGCWAQDPEQRPSMDEVVARLEAVQASNVLGAPTVAGAGGAASTGCKCVIC